MLGSRLAAIVPVLGALTACSGSPIAATPSAAVGTDITHPARTDVPHPPAGAADAALAWAAAYCGWSFDAPYGAREASARGWMSAAGGTALPVVSRSDWVRDVVDQRQVATCSNVAAHVQEGLYNQTTAYLLITADRTVTDRTGAVSGSTFVEPRRMVLVGGRWLVDVRVDGG